MFLFFLLQKFLKIICILTNYVISYAENYLSFILLLKIKTVRIILLIKLLWLLFFMFLKVKTLKTGYFEKKPSILDKFQWSHEKCSYFPIQRLECSCFFAYVLKMFLFLKKNKLLCSYKHGSYKKKRVFQLVEKMEFCPWLYLIALEKRFFMSFWHFFCNHIFSSKLTLNL